MRTTDHISDLYTRSLALRAKVARPVDAKTHPIISAVLPRSSLIDLAEGILVLEGTPSLHARRCGLHSHMAPSGVARIRSHSVDEMCC